MKKKLLSLALATVMVMSMSATALAATSATSVEASKTVTVVSSGTAPDETYKFEVTAGENTDTADGTTTPEIDSFEISYTSENDENTYTINLPTYTSVGIYYYTIKETAGNTAGVTYDETEYTLKVTVTLENGDYVTYPVLYKGEDKADALSFENKYTANTLTVEKQVTGNLGDTTKEFSFTVEFANDDDAISWTNAITYDSDTTGAASIEVSGNKVTFTLSDSDSITFSNIPSGIKYTVTEDDYSTDGYETTVNDEKGNEASGTMSGEDVSVTVVNDKTEEVDTGVNLDTLPYIMILAVVFAGAAYMVFRKRTSEKF